MNAFGGDKRFIYSWGGKDCLSVIPWHLREAWIRFLHAIVQKDNPLKKKINCIADHLQLQITGKSIPPEFYY